MTSRALIEQGFVTRVLHYSDSRQVIEVRGEDSNALYTSARARHDRAWHEGDTVAIYRSGMLSEAMISATGYRDMINICFLPPGEDALDSDDRAPRTA